MYQTTVVLITTAAFLTNATAHAREKFEERQCARDLTPAKIREKVDKFSTVRNAGYILLGLGGVALAAGIPLAATGEWQEESTSTEVQYNATDAKSTGGVVLLVIGIPMAITGTVLAAIGSGRTKRYEACLDYAQRLQSDRDRRRLEELEEKELTRQYWTPVGHDGCPVYGSAQVCESRWKGCRRYFGRLNCRPEDERKLPDLVAPKPQPASAPASQPTTQPSSTTASSQPARRPASQSFDPSQWAQP